MSNSPKSSSSESWEYLSRQNYSDTLFESDVENRAVALPPLSQGSNLSAATDTEDSETQSTPSLGQRDLDGGVLLTDSGSGHNTAESAMTINLGQSPNPDEEASADPEKEQQQKTMLLSEQGGADLHMPETTCEDDSSHGLTPLQLLVSQLVTGNTSQRLSACQEVLKCRDDATFLVACVEEGVVAGVAHSLLSKDVAVKHAATEAILCLSYCPPPVCHTALRLGVSAACTLLWEVPVMALQLLNEFFKIATEPLADADPAHMAAMRQACLDRGALLQVVHILQAYADLSNLHVQNPSELGSLSVIDLVTANGSRFLQCMTTDDPATLQLLASAAPTLMTTLLLSESSVAIIAAASLLRSTACLKSKAGDAAVEETLPSLLFALASTQLSWSGEELLDGSTSVALLSVAHQFLTANDSDALMKELASFEDGLLVLMSQPGGGPLLEIIAELVRCGATSTDAVTKALTDLPAPQTKGAKMALVHGSGEKGFKEQLLLSALKVGIVAESHRGFTAADCVAILFEQLEWRIILQDAAGLELLLCIIWINEVALFAADNIGAVIRPLRKAAAASWAPVPCQAIAISLLEGLQDGGYRTDTSLLSSGSLANVLAGIASSDPVVSEKQLGTLSSEVGATAIRLIADATKVFAAGFTEEQIVILPKLLRKIAAAMKNVDDSSVLLTFLAAGQQMLQQSSASQRPIFNCVAENQMNLIAKLINRFEDSTVRLECIRVGDQILQLALVHNSFGSHIEQRELAQLGNSVVANMLKQPHPKYLAKYLHGILPFTATAGILKAIYRKTLQPVAGGGAVSIDVRLAAAGFLDRWLPELSMDGAVARMVWVATLSWMSSSTELAERHLGLTTLATLISRGIATSESCGITRQTDGVHWGATALPILLECTASSDTFLSENSFDILTVVYRRWGGNCYLLQQPQDASFPAIAAAAVPYIVGKASNGEQQAVVYGLVGDLLARGFVSKDQLCVSAIVSALADLQTLFGSEIPANAALLAAIGLLSHVKDCAAFHDVIQRDYPLAISNLVSLLKSNVLPLEAAKNLRAVTAAILSNLQEAILHPTAPAPFPMYYTL